MASQPEQRSPEFIRLLLYLSGRLEEDDLKAMKLFLNEPIGEAILEKCTSGLMIFREMEKKGYLAENNTGQLEELLKNISRKDLLTNVQNEYRPSSGTSDTCTKIQNHLKKRYKTRLSKMTPFPFCELLEVDLNHVFMNLELVPGTKHAVSVPNTAMETNTNPDSDNIVPEIIWSTTTRTVSLIEGVAGIGKTTLCRRLAYLWSKGDNQICGHHFDMVFLVEARTMSTDLSKSIFKQLFPTDFGLDRDAIYKTLHERQNKSLLIIDGLDELPEECKSVVLDLIKGEYLDEVNIILTGRPESARQFIRYVKKHLRITGFTKVKAISYVRKFFGNDDRDLAKKLLHIFDKDTNIRSLAKNPFMTLIMCVLVRNGHSDLPTEENALIMELIKTIVKTYISKIDLDLPKEDTLIEGACNLAWFAVKNDLLQFTNEKVYNVLGKDVGAHILKSGVVNRDYSLTGIEITDFSYFPHQIIQDFLCVWGLARLAPEELNIKLREISIHNDKFWKMLANLTDMVINVPLKATVLIPLLITHIRPNNRPLGRPESITEHVFQTIRSHPHNFFVTCFQGSRLLKYEALNSMIFRRMIILMPLITEYADYTGIMWVSFTGLPAVVCQQTWPIKVEYLHVDICKVLENPDLKRATYPCIACSARDANRLLDSEIKLGVLNLTIVPAMYALEFVEIHRLISTLKCTQKNFRILITLIKMPPDDYFYLKMLHRFSCINNNNVHVRFVVTEWSTRFYIPRTPFSCVYNDRPTFYGVPKPLIQQYHHRFSPY